MHLFSLYLINFGDTVSTFFVSEYFLNFLLYVSCGSLIVYKCIHSIVVNLYRFFHLLTCSFKPLLFKGDLFSMAHPSILPSPFKFLFSLAFGGKFTLAQTESLTYSKHLLCNWFHFIFVIQMSCGEISRWMPPARTLFCRFAI